jgi:SAM-dependent methyltransferase
MIAAGLRWLLADPRTRGRDIDDPATTILRRDIIRRKPFLTEVYRDWYVLLAGAIPPPPGGVLELGSGAGFLSDVIPDCIASDVLPSPHVKVVLDGQALPFRRRALRAIVMTNVLHHIAAPYRFLSDAAQSVRAGGVIAMIEPWVTPWSRMVYAHLHHEPFAADADPTAASAGGPLSGANGALPWILFERERSCFDRLVPEWRVERVHPLMPFRYLVSGGVSMRSLMPGWTSGAWRRLEGRLERHMTTWAMFALVVLRRREPDGPRQL